MNKKGKQIELSAPQLSKLSKLMNSFTKVASLHIDKKVGKDKGDTNSIRTQEATHEVMKNVFNRLYSLGFQLEDFRNLQRRHIEQLVADWWASGVQPKTIKNYLSIIRKCTAWIDKPTLVPSQNALASFLPNVEKNLLKVSTLATKSKSWSEQGIDVVEKIKQANAICVRFGAMLILALAFGLRRKEQIRCIPSLIDGGNKLLLRGSVSKSGRDRDIEIVDVFQRYALDHAKSIARRGEALGWPRMTYKQAVNHYNYLMAKKLGITGADADCVGHGLRAEFSENLAMLLGFVPSTLGGSSDQLPTQVIKQIQSQVTRAMGHNRPEITGAYYGSVRLKPRTPGPKVCSLLLGDDLIALVYVNPMPAKDAGGEFMRLSPIQIDKSVVHVQIDRESQIQSEGIWQITGYSAELLTHIEVLNGAQRHMLSEKLQVLLSRLGWEK